MDWSTFALRKRLSFLLHEKSPELLLVEVGTASDLHGDYSLSLIGRQYLPHLRCRRRDVGLRMY